MQDVVPAPHCAVLCELLKFICRGYGIIISPAVTIQREIVVHTQLAGLRLSYAFKADERVVVRAVSSVFRALGVASSFPDVAGKAGLPTGQVFGFNRTAKIIHQEKILGVKAVCRGTGTDITADITVAAYLSHAEAAGNVGAAFHRAADTADNGIADQHSCVVAVR